MGGRPVAELPSDDTRMDHSRPTDATDTGSIARTRFKVLTAAQLPPDDAEGSSRRRLLEAVLDRTEGPVTVDPAGMHGESARRWILRQLDVHGRELADRRTLPGHLTGSALVVDPDSAQVVLMLHAKLARWLQPGGHADGDHELAGVALREATEETGIEGLRVVVPAIDLDIHRIPARGPEPEHLHLDLRFVVVAPPGATPVRNHESKDLRWVDPSDLPSLTDEIGLQRLVRRGLEVLESLSSDPRG